MEQIKLSIIIPVYNTAVYLPTCLDSVLKQTLTEIEIICVNDGSTDSSLEILRQYADGDRRIKIIDTKKNEGDGATRSKGLREAKGEYVGFIDSDDWIDPNMYQIMYEAAHRDDADIVICAIEQYAADAQTRLPRLCSYSKAIPTCLDDTVFTWRDIQDYIFNVLPVCWNKIYKRQFLKDSQVEFSPLGDYHRAAGEHRFEGLLFSYTALLSAKRMRFLRQSFYKWRRGREGAGSSTRSARPYHVFEAFHILDQMLARHEFNDHLRHRLEAAKVRMYFKQLYLNDADNMHSYFNTLQSELTRVNLHNPCLNPQYLKKIELTRDNSLLDFLKKDMAAEQYGRKRSRALRYKIGSLITYGAKLPLIGLLFPTLSARARRFGEASSNMRTRDWGVLIEEATDPRRASSHN
jgi:glycosyltransferase involved in cell wall biosynthesis